MATSDWLLAVTLFCAPLAEWTFQQAYDAVTSRSRRLWWETHYRSVVSDFLETYEAERCRFEEFKRSMFKQYGMAA